MSMTCCVLVLAFVCIEVLSFVAVSVLCHFAPVDEDNE